MISMPVRWSALVNGSIIVEFVAVAFESAGWDVTSIVRPLLLYAHLNSWFTDDPGILIPKRWANPCSRRCRGYQSQELQILQSSYYSLRIRTLRKSQQQELDFPNLHVNMRSFQSMVPISWLVKVKNGKNIEDCLHPHSLMCVSTPDFLLILCLKILFLSAQQ